MSLDKILLVAGRPPQLHKGHEDVIPKGCTCRRPWLWHGAASARALDGINIEAFNRA